MKLHRLALPTALVAILCAPAAPAQNKGEPGRFDFYLMNLAWSPEFCGIQGTSAHCTAPPNFVLHGLWAQNNDGSYPVFCSQEPGPAKPARNLDLTPDLALLDHEWAKHGTCSSLGPQRFFAMERTAYRTLRIPPAFSHIDHEVSLSPIRILGDFYRANPDFPQGSILIGCAGNRLTAVEACYSRDLHPIVCKGLTSCQSNAIDIAPPPAPIRP